MLFFSGAGNLHKGLDLALEAFDGLDQELHVVTTVEPAFASAYGALIRANRNIHIHGWVDARSSRFYDIVSRCAFAILPTCSEGQPGSVVECMNVGLIPLVTPEANLDVGGFGTLIDADVTAIRETIRSHTELAPEELLRRSDTARRVAAERHSPERFLRTLKAHLEQGLDVKLRERSSHSLAQMPPSHHSARV